MIDDEVDADPDPELPIDGYEVVAVGAIAAGAKAAGALKPGIFDAFPWVANLVRSVLKVESASVV